MPNDTVRKRRQSPVADAKSPDAWVDREVADCVFRDERLGKRFRSLLQQLSSSPGDSIPLVCRTGRTRKPRIDFSTMIGSVKQRFLAVTFKRRRTGRLPS